MLPENDGPSTVKKIKLPERKADILDMAESYSNVSEGLSTIPAADETSETVASIDSIICESYGSGVDLGYSSNESSSQIDGSGVTVIEENDVKHIASVGELCDVEPFGAEDINYDSVLFQFDTFFRRKLDSELTAFQENMHSMLTEQQIHLRKIICSVNPESTFEEEDREVPSVETVAPEIEPINAEASCEYRCSCRPEAETKTKTSSMMELLSLSCQITAMLAQQKFKS